MQDYSEETPVDELAVGQVVLFSVEPGTRFCGHVVSFDAERVALCFVEQLLEGGNKPLPNPILFVDRRDVRVPGYKRQ